MSRPTPSGLLERVLVRGPFFWLHFQGIARGNVPPQACTRLCPAAVSGSPAAPSLGDTGSSSTQGSLERGRFSGGTGLCNLSSCTGLCNLSSCTGLCQYLFIGASQGLRNTWIIRNHIKKKRIPWWDPCKTVVLHVSPYPARDRAYASGLSPLGPNVSSWRALPVSCGDSYTVPRP